MCHKCVKYNRNATQRRIFLACNGRDIAECYLVFEIKINFEFSNFAKGENNGRECGKSTEA